MRMISVAKPITTDVDKGRKRILKTFGRMKGSNVTVGVHVGEPAYATGVSVQDVAVWNEFGTKKIPERSFLRSTFDENMPKWRRRHRKHLLQVVLRRMTLEQALRKLGFEMQTEVQNKIETMRTPPNAPSTIKQKPTIGDNPLINSRKMKRSIKAKVHIKPIFSQIKEALGFK